MIRWNGVRFDVPDGVVDETVLTFTARPGLSFTVSSDELAGGKPALLRFVDEQLRAIRAEAPGYTVLGQSERAVAGCPAIHVEATITQVGAKRAQHQLYVLLDDRVVVAAATAPDANKSAAAAALDRFAASFTRDA